MKTLPIPGLAWQPDLFTDPLKADADCPCCELIGDSAVATPLSFSSGEHDRWLEHPDLCDKCREAIEEDREGDE